MKRKHQQTAEEKLVDAHLDHTSFGNIAMRIGHVSEEHLRLALAEQKREPARRLGAILADSGFISQTGLYRVCDVQDKLRERRVEQKYESAVERTSLAVKKTQEVVEQIEALAETVKGHR